MSDTNTYINKEIDDSFIAQITQRTSEISQKRLEEIEMFPEGGLPEKQCLLNQSSCEKPDTSKGAIPKIRKARAELPQINPNQLDSTRTRTVKQNGISGTMRKPDHCIVNMSPITIVDQPGYPAPQQDHQIPIRKIERSSPQVNARYESNGNIHNAQVSTQSSFKKDHFDVEAQNRPIHLDQVDYVPIESAAMKRVQHADYRAQVSTQSSLKKDHFDVEAQNRLINLDQVDDVPQTSAAMKRVQYADLPAQVSEKQSSLKNNPFDMEAQDCFINMHKIECEAIQPAATKRVQHEGEIQHVFLQTEGNTADSKISQEQSMHDSPTHTELNQPSDKNVRRGFNIFYTGTVVVIILYTTFYVWLPALRSFYSSH